MATLDLTNRDQVPIRGSISGTEEIVITVGSLLYVLPVNTIIAAASTSVAWADIIGKPTTFPPASHTHAPADIVGPGILRSADNLSDLSSSSTARTNLGLGTLATKSAVAVDDITATGTPGSTNFLRGDGSWQTLASSGGLLAANNLSDVASAATSRTNLGLGSVDNTSDANKPVSTAQQTALNLKANLASPALTGTPTAPTATAGTSTTQLATTAFVTTADALKADLASPALTGTPTAPTAASGTNTTQISTTAFVNTASRTNVSVVTASGNFTVPSNVRFIDVEVWGGGGGGGGVVSGVVPAAGGGGGGYTRGVLSVTPGQVIAVTIGAGGTAGAAGSNGGNGGTTTFSTLSSTGGAGGATPATGTGGAGGAGSGGLINATGNGGESVNGGTRGGAGGSAPMGGGGATGSYATGYDASFPGGGGNGRGASAGAGSAGGAGLVVITYNGG